MNKTRVWGALTLVVVLAVITAGWFLLVAPRRAEAVDLHGQAADQRTRLAALRVQLASLQAQAAGVPAARAQLVAIQQKLPPSSAAPDVVRSLTSSASSSGVELVSIAPGALTALPPPAPGSASPGGTSTATAAVLALPITIEVVGSYPEVERFLALLEELPRATRVSALAIAPGISPVAAPDPAAAAGPLSSPASAVDGSSLHVQITAQVYVMGSSVGAAPAGTTPLGATTTPPPSSVPAAPATSAS